jgi:hypothetical protein
MKPYFILRKIVPEYFFYEDLVIQSPSQMNQENKSEYDLHAFEA